MSFITLPMSNFEPIQPATQKLNGLIELLHRSPDISPQHLKKIIEAANLSQVDLLPWADFTHPVQDSYGRQLVYDGGHFEIMVMSWLPRDFSAIHDHGSTQWGAVQCFGKAEHYIYEFHDGFLCTLKSAPHTPGMVQTVDHDLIHQMGNRGTTPFLSLHIYGTAQPTASITGNARIFDLWEGRIQYTDGGVFFQLSDAQINRRDCQISGDLKTTLRHHSQLSDRLCQMLNEQYDSLLSQKLNLVGKTIDSLLFQIA